MLQSGNWSVSRLISFFCLFFVAGCGYRDQPYGTQSEYVFRLEITDSEVAEDLAQELAGPPARTLMVKIRMTKQESGQDPYFEETIRFLQPAAILNGEEAAYASSLLEKIACPHEATIIAWTRTSTTQPWQPLEGEHIYQGSVYVTWEY